MKVFSKFALCVAFSLLAGCAGVGVVASSDPLKKLLAAEDLLKSQDRPLIAERLIQEALQIYQNRDDPHGLGNAHNQYADLLLSQSVMGKWQNYYRKNGFRDRAVTYENRRDKASEYYLKAIEHYTRAESRFRREEKFDALTNVYFNMGWSAAQLGDRTKSCSYYDKALNAYRENIKRHPDAKPYSPTGSVSEIIESAKNREGCE